MTYFDWTTSMYVMRKLMVSVSVGFFCILSTVAQPHHPNKTADSHLAREPVCKPLVGHRFVVDLSVFPIETGPNSQKKCGSC